MKIPVIVTLVLVGSLLPAGSAAAEAGDDPPQIQECHRVLFLHYVDYSRHFVCVDTDPEADCHVSYTREAPGESNTICLA